MSQTEFETGTVTLQDIYDPRELPMTSKSRVNSFRRYRCSKGIVQLPPSGTDVDYGNIMLMLPHMQLEPCEVQKSKHGRPSCISISSHCLSDSEADDVQLTCDYDTSTSLEETQCKTDDESIVSPFQLTNCPNEIRKDLGDWVERVYPEECNIVPTSMSTSLKKVKKQYESRVPRKVQSSIDDRLPSLVTLSDIIPEGEFFSDEEYVTALEYQADAKSSIAQSGHLDSQESENVKSVSEGNLQRANPGSRKKLVSLTSKQTQHHCQSPKMEDKVCVGDSTVLSKTTKPIETDPLLCQDKVLISGNNSILSQEKNISYAEKNPLLKLGEKNNKKHKRHIRRVEAKSMETSHRLELEKTDFYRYPSFEEFTRFPNGDCSDYESFSNWRCGEDVASMDYDMSNNIPYPLPSICNSLGELATDNFESWSHRPLALEPECKPFGAEHHEDIHEVLPEVLFDQPVRIDFFDQRKREPRWVMLFSDKALEVAVEEAESAAPECVWRALNYRCKVSPWKNLKGLCNYRTETIKPKKIEFKSLETHHQKHHRQLERTEYATPDASPMNANFKALFTNLYKMKFRQYAASSSSKIVNVMTKAKSSKWQKRAGLYNSMFDEKYASDSFTTYAGRMVVLNMHHYLIYLIKMCREMKKNVTYVVYTLSICPPPAGKVNLV